MMKQITWILLVLLSPVTALAGSGAYKIRGYLTPGSDARHVIIEAGRESGLRSGEVFRAIRPAKGGIAAPVETGLLKVIAVHDQESVAEVIQQGTPESKAVYASYADVMAGDLALVQRISIAPAKVLSPEISIKYNTLFDDPKARPETFELTVAGKKSLRELTRDLAAMKVGMLMVEGHTDQKGESEQNQIESYQRALTVRQYLVDDLGFDESRVTAIGLGESEPLSDVILPGNTERSRRIVLKVVPIPGNQ